MTIIGTVYSYAAAPLIYMATKPSKPRKPSKADKAFEAQVAAVKAMTPEQRAAAFNTTWTQKDTLLKYI